MRQAWVVIGVLAGCVHSNSVPCGDRVCPGGTTCEETRQLCLFPEQLIVCTAQALPEGARCEARGDTGICQDTLCLPGCGDGTTNDLEECDDGNFASHDGCSSRCRVEVPVWAPIPSPWRPIQRHVAAYHAGLQRLVVVTGISNEGPNKQQWHRDLVRPPEASEGWTTAEADLGLSAAMPMPTPRTAAAMVYDSARDRLVLFGGVAGDTGVSADTWEYDTAAHAWSLRTTTTSPPARLRHNMVFDPLRNRVILFGGTSATNVSLGDTWEYDGTNWTQIVTTPSPDPRSFAGMTWDSTRNVAVLYGGAGDAGFLLDTWEYANGTWKLVTTTTTPSARIDAPLAYFPARQRTMLWGGRVPGGAGAASDLWEYDGSDWVQVPTPVSPPGRRAGTLTAVGNTLVLVGGTVNFAATPFDDVWELSAAATWTPHTPRFEPPSRTGPMAYDEDSRQIVVHAGLAADEQWAFDGTSWTDVTDRVTSRPPPRDGMAMSYDPIRKRVVMSGGYVDDFVNNTYELDGKNLVWNEVLGSPSALARSDAAMAYDGQTQNMILFGGSTNSGVPGDTWAFDGTSWATQPQATGPALSEAPTSAWDPKRERLVLVDNEGGTFAYDHGTWQAIAQTGDHPAARIGAQMTFDWQRERILLVGGQTRTRDFFDDVWELDGDAWTKLDVHGGSPLPRSYFGLTSHRWGRKTILFGGMNGAGTVPDSTWSFQFVSDTPDENCTDNVDDDGDLQADDIDPDCIRRAQ